MRSDVTKVGRERAPHRALLKATGLCDEEIRRPFIGVVNSFNDFIPGHIHLDKLGEAVKAGILSAGGVPFEFQTIGVCDGIAMGHKGMRYSLPSRELIEDSIEIMAEAHQLDGLVMIPSCDKIVPGHIMAAGRLNLPTIVVTGGPMMPGFACDKELDLINVFEGWQAGGETLDVLEEMACPGAGSCAGLFTANTMACLTEAMGLIPARLRHHSCRGCAKDAPGQAFGHEDHGIGEAGNYCPADSDARIAGQCHSRGHGHRWIYQYRFAHNGHSGRVSAWI